MSENKFIQRLKGEGTSKSVLEINNEAVKTSFANMPSGTSNATDIYYDCRGDATAVLKGTENWKLNNSTLTPVTALYGDGRDFVSTYTAFGDTTWVNATYTFSADKIFTAGTKWVLKLCGHSLVSAIANTIDFSLLIKFNNQYLITKNFTAKEQAFEFCQEFVVDFSESEQNTIKMANADTLTVQLLCSDATASATIYNGMTVLTALQRRTDGDAVASDTRTFDGLESDFDQFVIDTGTALDGKVNINGTSIMTAPLKFASGSMRGAVGPYLNGVGFWKMDAQGSITNIANLTDSRFLPVTTNAIDLGRTANTWKDLYLGGKVYVATINNGADLSVPNKSGTLATMGDVELAARSGRMLTDQGVWYAKMYSATVAPAAEDDTNYADFSQVDGDNNPIIVIYTRTSGAWVQSETITPPADYDGYVPVTSKIWDIAEQSGQQGGRVLWNHTSKEFTPYPVIISFEDIEVTGESTVIMPVSPSANQIVNKNYVDNLIPTVGDGTITLTQGGTTKGTFTVNQSGDTTIDLDAGGSGYHPDLFDWKWADHELDDVQWLRADTFSWQPGSTYEQAFWELFYDIQISTNWYREGAPGYTAKRYPEVGDTVYLNSDLTTPYTTVEAYDSVNDTITAGGKVYTQNGNTYVTPTTETVAGYTVSVYTGHSGRKITIPTYETAVSNIYSATGVAWYYIIDIPNKRFKLPRSKHEHYGDRPVVGNGTSIGFTEGTNNFALRIASGNGTINQDSTNYGASVGTAASTSYIAATKTIGVTTDATKSGLISTPAEDTGQYKYLYFYVGNFTQTAIENTAGLNAELFNEKVDVDFDNMTPSSSAKATIVGWGLPDFTTLTSVSSLPFTATQDCWVFITADRNSNSDSAGYITVNGTNLILFRNVTNSMTGDATLQIPVKAGTQIGVSGNAKFNRGYWCKFSS